MLSMGNIVLQTNNTVPEGRNKTLFLKTAEVLKGMMWPAHHVCVMLLVKEWKTRDPPQSPGQLNHVICALLHDLFAGGVSLP